MPKFTILPDEQNELRVRLVADNGDIIFITEGYSSRAAANHAISLMKHSNTAQVINSTPQSPPTILSGIQTGMDKIYWWDAGAAGPDKGKFRVLFVASNGKKICWTERYVNLTGASRAVQLLQNSFNYPIE